MASGYVLGVTNLKAISDTGGDILLKFICPLNKWGYEKISVFRKKYSPLVFLCVYFVSQLLIINCNVSHHKVFWGIELNSAFLYGCLRPESIQRYYTLQT